MNFYDLNNTFYLFYDNNKRAFGNAGQPAFSKKLKIYFC